MTVNIIGPFASIIAMTCGDKKDPRGDLKYLTMRARYMLDGTLLADGGYGTFTGQGIAQPGGDYASALNTAVGTQWEVVAGVAQRMRLSGVGTADGEWFGAGEEDQVLFSASGEWTPALISVNGLGSTLHWNEPTGGAVSVPGRSGFYSGAPELRVSGFSPTGGPEDYNPAYPFSWSVPVNRSRPITPSLSIGTQGLPLPTASFLGRIYTPLGFAVSDMESFEFGSPPGFYIKQLTVACQRAE